MPTKRTPAPQRAEIMRAATRSIQPPALQTQIAALMPIDAERYGNLVIFQVTDDNERRLTLQVPLAYKNRYITEEYDSHYRERFCSVIIETFGVNLKAFGGFFSRADLCTIFGITTAQGRLIEDFIVSETERFALSPRREAVLSNRLQSITNGLIEAAEAELEYLAVIRDMAGIKTTVINDVTDRALRISRHAIDAIQAEMKLAGKGEAPDEGAGAMGDPTDWLKNRTIVLEQIHRRVLIMDNPDLAPKITDVIEGEAYTFD